MTTDELIQWLRDFASLHREHSIVRCNCNEAADRLEELDERVAIMEDGKPEKPKRIMDQIEDVIGDICDKYCKFLEVCLSERKDPDEAEELLHDRYCGDCPFMRI